MQEKIIPISRSLFVCDYAIGYSDGRIDLGGIYNALQPAIYPHHRRRLNVFVQLSGGMGEVPFFIDIRREEDDLRVHTTPIRTLSYPGALRSEDSASRQTKLIYYLHRLPPTFTPDS